MANKAPRASSARIETVPERLPNPANDAREIGKFLNSVRVA